MVVVVYDTQIPVGLDNLGPLTILEPAAITKIVQRQATTSLISELVPTTLTSETVTKASTLSSQSTSLVPTTLTPETTASTVETVTTPSALSSETTTADTTSLTTAVNESPTSISPSSSTASSQPTAATTPPGTAQLSTGAIVGIAIGSIAALILLVTCLLFAFGFRIRRAKRQDQTEITESNEEQRPAIGTSGNNGGKAELEDGSYTRRLERLHNGAKPELDGSKPRKTGWRAFSIRSFKRGSRSGVAELDAGPVTKGPHELPA